MGGCAASRLGAGEEDDAVGICRERKRLLKSAVDRRYALADAHSRYIHSLYTVAGAISLFVARHSSPLIFSSLYRLPPLPPPPRSPSPPSSVVSFTLFVFFLCHLGGRGRVGDAAVGAGKGGNVEMGYGCYFAEDPPPLPSPMRTFGWDFFDPFDRVRAAEEVSVMAGLHRSSEEDLRVVREEEGIPELEEEVLQGRAAENTSTTPAEGEAGMVGRATVDVAATDGNTEKAEKGLTLLDTPARDRELLEALKDIVDHFIRAYDSGKEVSRMLEANTLDPHAGVEEKKENSSKLVQAIAWHRSPSTQSSSSYKSFLASSSRDSSWADGRSSLFDDYGGMASGSHSLTLERLYVWEKKLYEEVKAGDRIRRIYERKCSQLTNHSAKGVDSRSVDKTKSVAKDMYTRIWVAVRSVETISQRIQKLRDEELEPQLFELLKGLMETWRVMLESHETQNQIMLEVKAFTCPAYGKFCTNLHRTATFQLLAELQNWRVCFQCYLTAQKAYVEAIYGWLSKFIAPEVEFCSRGRATAPPHRVCGPKLLVICQDWLTSLQKLPEKSVSGAMKSFCKDLRILCAKQDEEQQQKRKVDSHAKELDKMVLALQRAENRILEPKLSELKAENDVWHRVEGLAERKDRLDMLRAKLEAEKAKHHECMQETQRVALNGFKSGLANILDALTDFSRDSLKLYNTLAMVNEKGQQLVDEDGKEPPTLTEGNEAEPDCR
ncbi:unnamed protein product [Spirodela intermedia]|uniref:Uncharacterized protein n=1 Tax=Spirodela intermedia TaxID=51605 RepID=A0A7I8IEH7_SPIIN|nr:unnamed protein product [Spirodela intermedia]CAA6656021.1 unnamed protein product [Spirodela intermedia]